MPYEELQDPYGKRFWPKFRGRDGCRTPMVWLSDNMHGGFSEVKPWLPVAMEHLPHVGRVAGRRPGLDARLLPADAGLAEDAAGAGQGRLHASTQTSDSLISYVRGARRRRRSSAPSTSAPSRSRSRCRDGGWRAIDGQRLRRRGSSAGRVELPPHQAFFAERRSVKRIEIGRRDVRAVSSGPCARRGSGQVTAAGRLDAAGWRGDRSMFLVCGEALFDFFLESEAGPAASTYAARAGGSPFNVAIGLARLGQTLGAADRPVERPARPAAGAGARRARASRPPTRSRPTGRRRSASSASIPRGVPAYQFYDNGSADTGVDRGRPAGARARGQRACTSAPTRWRRRRSPTRWRRWRRRTATASSRSIRTCARPSSPTWTSGARGWRCCSRSPTW